MFSSLLSCRLEFRGHHTYFGEMPRPQVPRALISGGRIQFHHLPAEPEGVRGNSKDT